MTIVNNHDAPASFISFCENDRYTKGHSDYSATQLIDEPRVVEFNRRYPELVIDDPYENPWKFISTIFHALMEQHSPEDEIAEERMFAEIGGVTISGAMDVQAGPDHSVTIGDYKMTTVYGIKDTKKFEQQLNIYAWLIESQTSKVVTSLKVYAFLRDWRISSSETVRGYPPTPGITIQLPLWDYDERESFIADKVSTLLSCKDLPDDDLPECTHEGRWPSGTSYRVVDMRDDSYVEFDRKGDAQKHWDQLDSDSQFNSALGKTFSEYRRCKSYCPFNKICNTYKGFLNERSNKRSR